MHPDPLGLDRARLGAKELQCQIRVARYLDVARSRDPVAEHLCGRHLGVLRLLGRQRWIEEGGVRDAVVDASLPIRA